MPHASSAMPLFEYFFTGKVLLPLCINFPGIDGDYGVGLCILVAYNIAVYVICLTITMSVESLECVIFVNMGMVSSIIINNLTELRDALLSPECSKCEIKQRLLHIVFMNKKYNEWVWENLIFFLTKMALTLHRFQIHSQVGPAFFIICLCQYSTASIFAVLALFAIIWVLLFQVIHFKFKQFCVPSNYFRITIFQLFLFYSLGLLK